MFYDSKSFRAMENGLSAAWLQKQTSSHNLANIETPNYKSKAVVFEDMLNKNLTNTDPDSPYSFQTKIVTNEDGEVRPDGNNVDSDIESMTLYKAYVQYSFLTQKMKGSFSNFRYVLNNAMK